MDYASHPERLLGVPSSIIEDDLPKIKPRHYSIVNDPFTSKSHHTSKNFKICFTVHSFHAKDGSLKQGFCTKFLSSLVLNSEFSRRIKV